jgi:hypothetical protein
MQSVDAGIAVDARAAANDAGGVNIAAVRAAGQSVGQRVRECDRHRHAPGDTGSGAGNAKWCGYLSLNRDGKPFSRVCSLSSNRYADG